MKLIAALLLSCLPTLTAFSQDAPTPELDLDAWPEKAKILDMANALARCAGLSEALSVVAEALLQTASAKYLHETYIGGVVAAQWLLAIDHNLRTGDQRTLGEYSDYVDGMAQTSRTRILALIETGGIEAVKPDMQECAALNELQTYIVQEARKSAFLK